MAGVFQALLVALCWLCAKASSSGDAAARGNLPSAGVMRGVSSSAQLASALSDDTVAVIELLRDITLGDGDFPTSSLAAAVGIVLRRSVTVRSAASVGRPALLDFNYVSDKIQLVGPEAQLIFQDLASVNMRSTSMSLAPGTDLLVASPPPEPGVARPRLVFKGGIALFGQCAAAARSVAAAPLAPRPDDAPGTQTVAIYPNVPNCVSVNDTRSYTNMLNVCWPSAVLMQDVALDGRNSDPVGGLSLNGYVVILDNNILACFSLVSDECIAQYGQLKCMLMNMKAVAKKPQQVWATEPAANASDTQQSPPTLLITARSGGGGKAHDVDALAIALPAALGGAAALVLLAATVLFLHRRRLQRSEQQPVASKDSVTVIDVDSVHTAHQFEHKQALCNCASGQEPIDGAPKPGSTDQLDLEAVTTETSLHPAEQLTPHPDTGSPTCCVPLTERTPCREGVRLDLRWGADIVAHQDALRGAGSFGRVVEGAYLGRSVAVKLLHNLPKRERLRHGETMYQTAVDCLRQEVHVLSRCSHPNVVALLGACLTPPHLCLVMELMDQSLEQLINSCPNGKLPREEALSIAHDLACGLAYLHPTVVHRDLKPANVLLDARGTAKLSDFGLARLRETVCETKHPEAGTAPYMAPECFDPTNNIITHKADIYSWAVLVWQMMAGQRPWDGLNPMAIALAVTFGHKRLPLWALDDSGRLQKLQTLLAECWDVDPQRRPCAEEVAKRILLVQRDLARCEVDAAAASSSTVAEPTTSPSEPLHLLDVDELEHGVNIV